MRLVWDEFLKIIKEEAGSQVVETWFKVVIFENWDPATGLVVLRAPNQFIIKWIQEHYDGLIKKHLARLLNFQQEFKIQFLCETEKNPITRNIIPASVDHSSVIKNGSFDFSQLNSNYSKSSGTQIVQQSGNAKLVASPSRTKERGSNLISDNYHFDNFVVGPHNSLAHAAAKAISENLGRVYNPLFIYGGTGLGKTHLLHAIGNNVMCRNPNAIVRYVTTDSFVSEFISCVRMVQMRNKYQKIDLLMLDDIQFLSNKEQTQETFFHIFNTLYEQQKQIVLSSDTFPKEINGLQNRLKSRMESGLVADIQIPDLETKIAILCKKAELHNFKLSDEVADYIASRVVSNIRELEGALIRVGAFASLTNQPVSLEMARKVLLNLHERKKEGVMLDSVLKIVSKQFDVLASEVKSKKRHKDIAFVRQVVLYMMKKHTICSLQAIGEFVGGRDHSTVIHAINKIEGLAGENAAFLQKLRAIEQEILSS